jgi:DNA-binding MarR family transcriptional regulator
MPTTSTARRLQKKHPRPLFVHLLIDEAGLDPYEFRLLAHIARRGSCFASLSTTAEICRMSVRKTQYALKSLCEKGLVVKTSRQSRTNIFKLAPDLLEKLAGEEQTLSGTDPDADVKSARTGHTLSELDPHQDTRADNSELTLSDFYLLDKVRAAGIELTPVLVKLVIKSEADDVEAAIVEYKKYRDKELISNSVLYFSKLLANLNHSSH